MRQGFEQHVRMQRGRPGGLQVYAAARALGGGCPALGGFRANCLVVLMQAGLGSLGSTRPVPGKRPCSQPQS